jgi:hypothetical protein
VTKICKFKSCKKLYFYKKWKFFIPRTPRRNSKLKDRLQALERKNPKLQNNTGTKVPTGTFLYFLFHFAYMDPVPADQNQCGSGSTTEEESNKSEEMWERNEHTQL